MPDVDAIIQHGALPDTGDLVDEPNVLVQNLTITPAREKKLFKGANKATQGVQYTDPTCSFVFQAIVSELAGLGDQHPGTQVSELANYSATIHGFDPEQGMMVYEDPSRELSIEDPAMVNFTVFHYPFMEPAA